MEFVIYDVLKWLPLVLLGADRRVLLTIGVISTAPRRAAGYAGGFSMPVCRAPGLILSDCAALPNQPNEPNPVSTSPATK